ncbi:Coiled-coil domain-containing protein 113 [Durusdinium trenchii]|uniref:Coiled-coil domain-containing protein 113 n=1 Tax=Durusdinium trenchii TaxID=1381693 RepID=A0ABP0P915_9DINO
MTLWPTWNGDPAQFESFSIACRWLEHGWKDSERKNAAPRVWSRLQGAAKAVVRHLDPTEYVGEGGLTKLLAVFLRASPLQQLPVPDSFQSIERWHALRRRDGETMAELLVHDEDLWTEMQQALRRARDDRQRKSIATPTRATDEVSTPSQPGMAARLLEQEKQNILTQTSNSTEFELVKRALRTLFAEDESGTVGKQSKGPFRRPLRGAFYNEEDVDEGHQSAWDEWGEWSQDQWYEPDAWNDTWFEEELEQADELQPEERSDLPEEQEQREAYALAAEAQRTMQEAREAVRKVRQARGYFAPESSSGKGMSPSSPIGSSGGKGSKSSASSSSGRFGPCFICGQPGHSYKACPDRFSPGKFGGKGKLKSTAAYKGKGTSFGGGFGKGTGSHNGPNFFADVCSLTLFWNEDAKANNRYTNVVIDTGASESAVGAESLSRLLEHGQFAYSINTEDRPIFRFENVLRMQATSRCDIENTAIGNLSFYVLGDAASSTPPLLGSKATIATRGTLRKSAAISQRAGKPASDAVSGSPTLRRRIIRESAVTWDRISALEDMQKQGMPADQVTENLKGQANPSEAAEILKTALEQLVSVKKEKTEGPEMTDAGFLAKRVNYKEGYDLASRRGNSMLKQEKKRSRDLKRASEAVDAFEPVLAKGDDLTWEWPSSAAQGWRSHAIRKLQFLARKYNRPLYWCRIDGCAYDRKHQEMFVRKGTLWINVQRRCPGHTEHAECRGAVAQASSYYPPPLVKAVCKAVQTHFTRDEDAYHLPLSKDAERYLLDIPKGEVLHDHEHHRQLRDEDPRVFALTRSRFPVEPPTGKKLEQIRQQMLRVHGAGACQAPEWAIKLAGSLECPACIEANRAKPAPVASLKEAPGLFEILGMDCFELEHGERKAKFFLMRDRASGLIMTEFYKLYGGKEGPRIQDIIRAMTKWLMVNPAPRWVITDSATYFTPKKFLDYCGHSGIGVLTAPAEAHKMMGPEEGAIRVMKRLVNEDLGLSLESLMQLAVHGHNPTIGSSGFSPFQF